MMRIGKKKKPVPLLVKHKGKLRYVADVIAEQELLERPLRPNEMVVHKDGNKYNNALDNLDVVLF